MLANMKYVRRERYISTPIATSSTRAYPLPAHSTIPAQRCLLDSKADHDAEIDLFDLRSDASEFCTLLNFALALAVMIPILTLVAAILYSVNSHKITQHSSDWAFAWALLVVGWYSCGTLLATLPNKMSYRVMAMTGIFVAYWWLSEWGNF
jgi:hypothetical protein